MSNQPHLATRSNGTLKIMKSVTRLYKNFQPSNYNVVLDINPLDMQFKGSVLIRGKKVGRPSQRITLHQKDLKIISASIVKHDKKGDEIKTIARVNTHDSFNEVRLHTEELLFPGEYSVEIQFESDITRPMNGIYPSFFEQNNIEKTIIATQFESHHAREAFPSIDEPEAKATFDLTLVTPKGQTVIANTPIKAQKSSGKRTTTTFETTPKMSTYLVAFVVGDLKYTEATTKDNVVVRCYATPENVTFTNFALEVAVKCLEFYNDYFDIAYPLAKCDFIALPDFASGAMENWGCITFREQGLLVDPANTSLSIKQYVASVVAHELTHQWFGNLVTMRWWTDLWLNEGFATWMSYLAVDNLFPEWKVWTQFIVDEQQSGMKLDALQNTHPVEVPVHHPDEIRTIFDNISYDKGGSLLQMLSEYLGPEAYRDGLRYYLKQHSYGSTDTIDLWAALEHITNKPVKDFMHAWTSQPGFPILRASIDKNELLTYQERFYLNPQNSEADTEVSSWPIPLLANIPLPNERIDTASSKLPLKISDSALILNSGRSGFYRVVYNPSHLTRLTSEIKNDEVSVLNRLGLLSDMFEASKAGHSKTVEALKLLEAFDRESDSSVWDIIAGNLGSIRMVMNDNGVREDMKPYLRKLTKEQFVRLGWNESDKDSHFDRLLRPTILGLASLGETTDVVDVSIKKFNEMEKPEDIHPDIRGIVYGTAVRHGGNKEFDKLFDMHENSKNSEERVTIAAALTGFKQKSLIQKSLTLITSKSVRLQDAPYWIAYSFGNRFARDLTWEWMKDNWEWLENNLGTDLSFYRMPIYVARSHSDIEFLPSFKQFFESHMSVAFDRPVKQAIEVIEWQAAWRKRDLKSIQAYFKKAASQN